MKTKMVDWCKRHNLLNMSKCSGMKYSFVIRGSRNKKSIIELLMEASSRAVIVMGIIQKL